MTPEQITLVQSSFDRLGPNVPELATRFYAELFARDPGLRPLFTTDLELQKVRFADKLTEIVRSIPRLQELLSHTRALGARHVGYGVHVADYRTVGDALQAALAATLGDAFDPATRQAWVTAYSLVAETMLQGAATSPARAAEAARAGNRPGGMSG